MTKTDSLQALMVRIDTFMKERSWRAFHDQQSMLMALSVEVSELMELFLWHKNEDLPRVVREKKELISHEFADVFVALIEFALISDISIVDAVESKLALLEKRYPAKEVSEMNPDQLRLYKEKRKKDGYK